MARIAVVGSGFVGRAWAIAFARGGHEVALWDEDRGAPARAIDFVRSVLPELDRNDLLLGRRPTEILALIRPEGELGEALSGVDHVQENVPERVEVKRAVFATLDRLAPAEAVLASSTSAILPSQFSDHLAGRARCLVAHPVNPPYLIPSTELVPAPWTSSETVERTRVLMLSVGQAPIVMKREIDGFVINRLQGALLEEAFRLVADGVASVEDIDVALRDGLALRWSFMGPFETIDLNAPGGVRDYIVRYQSIYANLFPQMQRRVDWAGEVLAVVEAGRRARLPESDLGKRQVWRDRRLMALLAAKRRADEDIGK
jgi:3-hydroxyacyl-CoA dehydrogenase